MSCDYDIPADLERLSIFRGVLSDPIVDGVVRLVSCTNLTVGLRADIFRLLAESAEFARQAIVGNAWQNHLVELILADENPFTRKGEVSGVDGMGPALLDQSRVDLDILRHLYDIDVDRVLDGCPSVSGFSGFRGGNESRRAIKTVLQQMRRWSGSVDALAEFLQSSGVGRFGRFRAFRWMSRNGVGGFHGVESPDPIRLSDLVEYGWQREAVKRNTEKLLAGAPTNNMLLYGNRGTGKSSSVKAMLNEFPKARLRLIEVAKDDLLDLPEILSTLRKRPEKFILFLDDLSFEENEVQYKAMKAVLEGGLEARPANVVLYATSNRRNLVKERFTDRSDDEVHPGDTMQEKLSLADRFGISVPFLAPDPEEFMRIVGALAQRAGIDVTDDLRRQAMNWQHARSGRSARQFVEYLIGERALGSGAAR